MIHMGHGHGVYIDASLKMARRYANLYLEDVYKRQCLHAAALCSVL